MTLALGAISGDRGVFDARRGIARLVGLSRRVLDEGWYFARLERLAGRILLGRRWRIGLGGRRLGSFWLSNRVGNLRLLYRGHLGRNGRRGRRRGRGIGGGLGGHAPSLARRVPA